MESRKGMKNADKGETYMAILDMFDKIDDIVYKPVEAVCNWVGEPLKKWEHKRRMQSMEQAARVEAEMREREAGIETQRNEEAARLQVEQRKWNAEIDQMIAEQEDARRDRLVEALKRYQIELASASRDIVNSIGMMSLELRSRANVLVLEKTQAYRAIQDEAKTQSMRELQEAKEMFFETDPETYHLLVNDIMQERRTMVETAGKFIVELSEDLKRLNQNSDELMRMGMDAVTGYLKPVASAIGIVTNVNSDSSQMIEEKDIIEGEIVG